MTMICRFTSMLCLTTKRMPTRQKNVERFNVVQMVSLSMCFLIEDRNKTIGNVEEIRAWVGFKFPGRAGKYSKMRWHWYHFNGTDRVRRIHVFQKT